jgi:HAD superfamily hydrolase (TIGR01509 family)
MTQLVVFLDDGGVINDPPTRREQWYPLVGEFFVPRLGGAPEAWSAANRQVITRMLDRHSLEARVRAAPEYKSYDPRYKIDWLRWMCEIVGVPAPAADEDCVALSTAAYHHITRKVRSALPGAVEAIQTLRRRGYVLHTASGESSEELDGYLEGTGVRDCFDRLYGPDLVDTVKDGPRFYERIFADAGVAPRDALVVDDNPAAARWAAEVGAKSVLVGPSSTPDASAIPRLGSLAELPALVERLSRPPASALPLWPPQT